MNNDIYCSIDREIRKTLDKSPATIQHLEQVSCEHLRPIPNFKQLFKLYLETEIKRGSIVYYGQDSEGRKIYK